MKTLLIVISFLFFVSCSGGTEPDGLKIEGAALGESCAPPVTPCQAGLACSGFLAPGTCLNEEEEKARCEAQNGIWGIWGLSTTKFCNLRLSDGGTPCTSGDECHGDCIIPVNQTTGPGKCQDLAELFGCFSTLEDGQPTGPGLCRD